MRGANSLRDVTVLLPSSQPQFKFLCQVEDLADQVLPQEASHIVRYAFTSAPNRYTVSHIQLSFGAPYSKLVHHIANWFTIMDPSKVQKPPVVYGPPRRRKTFVLCFDGTGNKFSGTEGDSNILKIYRMLDRGDPDQLHYYQASIHLRNPSLHLYHTCNTFRGRLIWMKTIYMGFLRLKVEV